MIKAVQNQSAQPFWFSMEIISYRCIVIMQESLKRFFLMRLQDRNFLPQVSPVK